MISPASYTSSPSLSSSSHVSCSEALEFSSKCSSSSSDPLPSSSDCTVAAAPGVVGAAARPAARPAGVGAAAAFAFSLWHCLESVMLTVMAGGDAAISGWTRADGRRAGAPKSGCNQTQRPPGHHRAAKRTASEIGTRNRQLPTSAGRNRRQCARRVAGSLARTCWRKKFLPLYKIQLYTCLCTTHRACPRACA